jgi:hypothetical protein
MAKRKKTPAEMAALASIEKKRLLESMRGLAKERDLWRIAAIVLAALALVWLWSKLRF